MNYAIPGAPQYQQFQTNPWAQEIAGYTDYMSRSMNESPRTAIEEFLRIINPSQSSRSTLRAMAPMLEERWNLQEFNQGQLGQTPPNWTEYLRDFDYGREFARLAPAQRAEQPQRFTGRARTITY